MLILMLHVSFMKLWAVLPCELDFRLSTNLLSGGQLYLWMLVSELTITMTKRKFTGNHLPCLMFTNIHLLFWFINTTTKTLLAILVSHLDQCSRRKKAFWPLLPVFIRTTQKYENALLLQPASTVYPWLIQTWKQTMIAKIAMKKHNGNSS